MEYEKEITSMVNGTCLFNEPMSKHTTYGIGGPASFYIKPQDKEYLSYILLIAESKSIPVYFVGTGSNILVSDSGIKGIVVSLDKSLKKITFLSETMIYAEGGAMLGRLVKLCISNNLTGLESHG